MRVIKRLIKLLVIFVLVFDLLIIVLANNDYYFTFLKKTGIIFPTLITIISLYLLAWIQKIKGYWIFAGSVVAFILLGKIFLTYFVTVFSYDYIKSPTGDITLVIEHRDATLGETHHFYNFYRNTAFPMVIKKLNKDTVSIVTRGTNDDNLEVLGVNNAEWIEGEGVIFYSKYAKTKVNINTVGYEGE
ncbi:hypothetical protein KHA94_09610 [Bacillus sp. FJAT-49705]|uniref:Uncharacterized protein n=1 Tax=Cytobacillus citreus TaxID=2833586 RepID=A0ABS5NRL5_9BACI|nr:hypothetical protein [Cytobacillus citreus]MBS4190445.1 hypothetical protein [Cytobacillus citreus]